MHERAHSAQVRLARAEACLLFFRENLWRLAHMHQRDGKLLRFAKFIYFFSSSSLPVCVSQYSSCCEFGPIHKFASILVHDV